MQAETKTILSAFKAFEGHPHRGSSHIDKVYEEARQALDVLPIPTRRTEAWKYTPVNKISNHDWRPAINGAEVSLGNQDFPVVDAHQVIIVDGHLLKSESELFSKNGIHLLSMGDAKEKEQAHFERIYGQQTDHKKDLLVSLNTAFASGGMYLRIEKRIRLEKPVHVIHVNTQADTAVMTRNIIIAEEGAEGEIIQSFIHKAGAIHSNSITEVELGDNAKVTLDKFQSGTDDTCHYSSEEVHQGRDSSFTLNTITISGGWTRNDPHVRFNGSNSVCYLNGAYLPMNKELIDNHSIIDHLVPHCESHELYKGVIYDQGKGVFNGKVFVRPDAQKTNAYQQNANIVMSEKASMNSKPELEIYADDVKCSHGSTTGQIDKEALFYLQCRGLSKVAAKQMLVNAFVGEVIEQLNPELQDYAWARLSAKTLS